MFGTCVEAERGSPVQPREEEPQGKSYQCV